MDKITLNINDLPQFSHNMMTIKERNAKDLQNAWKKHLKEQKHKNVKQGKQTQMQQGD